MTRVVIEAAAQAADAYDELALARARLRRGPRRIGESDDRHAPLPRQRIGGRQHQVDLLVILQRGADTTKRAAEPASTFARDV